MRKHDHEPVPGLPEDLPQGEAMLWRGGPDMVSFALHVLHARAIAIYFIVMGTWQSAVIIHDGGTIYEATMSAVWYVGLCAAVLAIVYGYAWLVSRTTIYTITNCRVVMRFGIALPMIVNLPLNRIESADLLHRSEDVADLSIATQRNGRPSYLLLWPHVRPWLIRRPEPSLRCVRDGAKAAKVLSSALAAESGQSDVRIERVGKASAPSGQLAAVAR